MCMKYVSIFLPIRGTSAHSTVKSTLGTVLTMESEIKSSVLTYLGKKANKYWRDLACDIIAVYQHLKPGFLYDYGIITASNLSSVASDIVQALLGKESTAYSKLCIISLGQDMILANQSLLLRRLDEQRDKMRVGTSNVMDISENLATPQILSLLSPSGIKLQDDIDHLYTQIRQTIPDEQVDKEIVEIKIDDDLNLTTIFGLLIGYPVLYWYSGDAQASNCLDMVPLVVYEVVCNVTLTAQTKHATEAKADDIVELEKCQSTYHETHTSSACGNIDKDFLKQDHVVFSFSVPECLVDNLSGLVASWFESLQTGGKCGLITKLRKKTVTLPTVAL